MISPFDEPIDPLLARFRVCGAARNLARSLRAAYMLDDQPWIGGALREAASEFAIAPPPVLKRTEADDGTTKLLVTFPDPVECVLIPAVRGEHARDRMSARNRTDGRPRKDLRPMAAGCISTQVGCAAGCSFCASGTNGLTRNLTVGEIVVQALMLRREAVARGMRLATLVFMGMGEPLHNTANVIGAIGNLTHVAGGAFAPRGVTVSTVGVLPGMKALSASRPAPHLAVSLHAPDDATRAKIVRTAPRLWTVAETLEAASEYRVRSGREVTISYVLLDGVNDCLEQAELLARLIEGRGFHVNLIPFNAAEGLPFRASPPDRAQAFWNALRARRLSVHFRRPRGAGEDAACGQLRRRVQPA